MKIDSSYLLQLQVEKVLAEGSQFEKLSFNEQLKAQFLVKLVSTYNQVMEWQAQMRVRN